MEDIEWLARRAAFEKVDRGARDVRQVCPGVWDAVPARIQDAASGERATRQELEPGIVGIGSEVVARAEDDDARAPSGGLLEDGFDFVADSSESGASFERCGFVHRGRARTEAVHVARKEHGGARPGGRIGRHAGGADCAGHPSRVGEGKPQTMMSAPRRAGDRLGIERITVDEVGARGWAASARAHERAHAMPAPFELPPHASAESARRSDDQCLHDALLGSPGFRSRTRPV